MIDALVLGDANPDLVLRGDVVPRFGQAEQLLDTADLVVGGSGAIVAHGLARLGTRPRLVATVGDDTFGQLVRERLAVAGVDVTGLETRPVAGTGLTVVLTSDEDRALLTYPGAIPELTADKAAAAVDLAADDGARHVHVSSYYLLPRLASGLEHVLEQARARGMSTSLDTNFDPSERWTGVTGLLRHLDLLLPNSAESCALGSALQGEKITDPLAAAALLAGEGPTVVVKLGAAGAAAVAPNGDVRHEAGTAVPPVDTTGAGDSFVAAYLDAHLRRIDPVGCLRRACRAGALSTSAVGGTAGQPVAAQLDEHDQETATQ